MPRAKVPPKVPHRPEVRAAVIAALLAGQSVSQVAKTYKLPKGTVSNWKHRKNEGVRADASPPAVGVPPCETQKSLSIADLLVELVRENLKGLIAGARLLQDSAWLREQGGAEVGTLLGITNDKTVRMLEALGGETTDVPAPTSPPPAPEPPTAETPPAQLTPVAA